MNQAVSPMKAAVWGDMGIVTAACLARQGHGSIGAVVQSLKFLMRRAPGDSGLCGNPKFLRAGTILQDFGCPPLTISGERDQRRGKVLDSGGAF